MIKLKGMNNHSLNLTTFNPMSEEGKLNIKSWAEEDRPREKLLFQGRGALSDAELLAILLRSGSRNESAVELSKRILALVGNNLNDLGKTDLSQLMEFKGVGEAKAITIVAALELGRRRKLVEVGKKAAINSSQDAYFQLFAQLSDLPNEEFWIILLNRRNQILEKRNISKGGVSGTVADAKLIFKPAIERLASGIILAHNHPSGNLTPSNADRQLTKKLIRAGQDLDINVLDHLIIGDDAYFSFKDEGLM